MSTLVSFQVSVFWMFVLSILSIITSSDCTSRVEKSGCFSVDPWKDEWEALDACYMDPDFRPADCGDIRRAIGFCEFYVEDFDKILPGYTRSEIDLVVSCRSTEHCAYCADEQVDNQILETYRWYQEEAGCPADEREVLAYTRGCVSEEEDDDGNALCCYSGAFVSECRVGLLTTEGARPVETPAPILGLPPVPR